MIPATSITDEHKLNSLAADELVVGKGGFGKVYKGYLQGLVVAIKRLDSFSNQGPNEFMTEIQMLSKFRHCNLVSLIGYCSDGDEKILVYEFMPNGTIEHHLHKACTPLSWIDRLKISIGAARGLDYLHTGVGTQEGVIHRDVKSSNILLDENWAAKISDFGLSKVGPINQPSSCVSTLVKGTFGYLDPEYSMTGHLTRKSDVYAFGVVLFELLSGRRAVDRSFDEDEWGLANWAQQRVKERRLDQIVCSQISGQVSPKCLKEFTQIADRCLRSSRKDRPTMAEVVVALQLSMTLQQQFITSTQLAGAIGFTNLMQKYLVFGTKNTSVDSEPKKSRDEGYSGDFEQLMNQEVKIYSYSDMEVVTRNFSREMFLGRGEFGEVFRGWFDKKTYRPSKLDRGLAVAVKRLYSDKFEPRKLNMKILEEFKDANVVKVLGYCVEDESVLIVYEFMHRGTLKDYLFSSERRTERHELITRVKIAIGVGRGLVFLRTQPQLADGSLRIHNIFLDKEFNIKLSDFDVVMLAPTNRDFQPSSSYDLELTIDVFGFGVILLQLLSGKPISESGDLTQIKHCFPGEYGFVSMQSIYSALDDRLRLNFPMRRQVFQLALLAQKCVLEEPLQRPTLELALEEVEEIYDIMLKSENSTDN